jgi:hypothetical protein
MPVNRNCTLASFSPRPATEVGYKKPWVTSPAESSKTMASPVPAPVTVIGWVKVGLVPPMFSMGVKLAVPLAKMGMLAGLPPTETVWLAALACTVVTTCDPRMVSADPARGRVIESDVVLASYWSCKPAPITSPAKSAVGELL